MDMSAGFEQLLVWQRARAFCAAIAPVLRAARSAHDYELSQELNGAGISIMSNIAEGHLRRARRQFVSSVEEQSRRKHVVRRTPSNL
jgi:hypothetical protein